MPDHGSESSSRVLDVFMTHCEDINISNLIRTRLSEKKTPELLKTLSWLEDHADIPVDVQLATDAGHSQRWSRGTWFTLLKIKRISREATNNESFILAKPEGSGKLCLHWHHFFVCSSDDDPDVETDEDEF